MFVEAAEVLTMGRPGFAFKILFSGDAARQPAEVFSGSLAPATQQVPPEPVAPVCSEAVTSLAAFQRDARFLDFAQESIEDYHDAQVGAATDADVVAPAEVQIA